MKESTEQDRAEAAVIDTELAAERIAEGKVNAPPKGPSIAIPLTVATGFMMEGLNSTIVNTSLPQIGRSLNATPVELSIAVTSYILSLAVFIPISGWVADRFGARRVFCIAIATFVCGSMLCGLSTSLPMLVAMRVVQGLGGAMMTPVGRLILARSFPKDQLLRAMNYMQIPGLIGPVLGPVVGGFITTYFSWHWVFFINVPVGIVAIILVLNLIKDVPMEKPPALDIRGFVIVGIGLAFAQLSLEYIGRESVPLHWQATFLVMAVATLSLYFWHARRHPAPILDLKLFRIRTFAVSVTAGSVSRMAIGAIPFLLPLLFQVGFGMDAFHSGMLVACSTFGSLLMRFGVPTILRLLGIRRALMSNSVIVGFLLMGFIFIHQTTPIWFIVIYVFAVGFIRAIQFSTLGALSYADLPHEMMGRGTSIAAVAQRMSLSSGIAVSATLLALFSGGGGARLTEQDFGPVFILIGLVELASTWGYRRLSPDDAAVLSGHKRRG